jgi:hypothetical protein
MSDEKTAKEYFKFDGEGKVSRFPGITVVAAVKGCEYDEHWQEIYQLIQTVPGFSALPPSSYHMTLCDVTHVRKLGNTQELLRYCMQNFGKLEKIISDFDGFQPAISSFKCGFPPFGLRVKLEDTEAALTYRTNIYDSLAIGDYYRPYEHHITFAYFTGKKGEGDKKLIKEVEKKIEKILKGKKIVLEPARLCYFNDMAAFHPLDFTFDSLHYAPAHRSTVEPIQELVLAVEVSISKWEDIREALNGNTFVIPEERPLWMNVETIASASDSSGVEDLFSHLMKYFKAIQHVKKTENPKLVVDSPQVLIEPDSGISLTFSNPIRDSEERSTCKLAVVNGLLDPSSSTGLLGELYEILSSSSISIGVPTLQFLSGGGQERFNL